MTRSKNKASLSRSFQGIVVLVVTVFLTSTMYILSILEDARTLEDIAANSIPQPMELQHTQVEDARTLEHSHAASVAHVISPPIRNQELRQQELVNDGNWTRPYVHIINTRFMQHQGNLTDLARARLVLFETFCLETILKQTVWKNYKKGESPPFLWIIKTDPKLNPQIRDEMIQLLKPHPFIYLVASNVNFGIGIHPGGWRGGEAGEDLFRSKIYTGNLEWLRQAHAVRNERAILETRLDADDGLNVQYLQVIHEEAIRKLKWSVDQLHEKQRLKWRYWCSQNHLEWSPTPVFGTAASEYGLFVPRKSPRICVTPGLTLGVSVGETERSVPRYPHQKIYENLMFMKKNQPDCGDPKKCLRMVTDPLLAAIRSRTATSAGMKNVATKEKDAKKLEQYAVPVSHKQVEHVLKDCFRVHLAKVAKANAYMQNHLGDIVQDNLEGQCTHGHSCKNSTVDALKNLLIVASNRSGSMKQ